MTKYQHEIPRHKHKHTHARAEQRACRAAHVQSSTRAEQREQRAAHVQSNARAEQRTCKAAHDHSNARMLPHATTHAHALAHTRALTSARMHSQTLERARPQSTALNRDCMCRLCALARIFLRAHALLTSSRERIRLTVLQRAQRAQAKHKRATTTRHPRNPRARALALAPTSAQQQRFLDVKDSNNRNTFKYPME